MTMRILVCGGRDYGDEIVLYAALDEIHGRRPVTRLIHGAARGADSLAAAWAKSRGVPTHAFPADWKRDGRAAGFLRNARMVRDGRPDLVVAFPGGKGTAHMVRLARDAGLPVLDVPTAAAGPPRAA
jgi:hypothetical protein